MDGTARRSRRVELYSLLGDLPDRLAPIEVHSLGVRDCGGYRLEELVLDLNGVEPVGAYFSFPAEGDGPWPVVLYNHAHGGEYEIGRRELIEPRKNLQSPPYAAPLAERGWAALCIDHWAFGDRRGRSKSDLVKEMLWCGQVMWGMMVFDSLRALDYLVSRPDVQAGRIATLGISMGSTMGWWASALDPRIKVCVDLCCMTDFQALVESRGLGGHAMYYFVPRLLKHFTTAEINALVAPRAHLSLNGVYDHLTPPAGLERIDAELRQAYQEAGAPDAWRMINYPTGHYETAEMRQEVLAFLAQHL